ncbi:unnamed protein product [Choristocarpus tenellus]
MYNFLRSAGLALLLATSKIVGAEITEEDGVLVLNGDNFAEAIAQNPTLLVEFYAPWCGHCKKLAPEYATAAGELKAEGLNIAKVDADQHKDLAKEYGVSGFPTLKLFKEGKPVDYNAGRTANDIVAYVKKKAGPSATTVDSTEALTVFVGDNEAVVVGLFASVNSDQAKAFMKVADGMDRLPFAISSAPDVIAAYGSGDMVVVVKTYDDLKSEMSVSADTTVEEMETFISTYSMRLITTFSPATSQAIFGGPIKVHMLVMADEESDDFASLMESVTKVADKQRGKMLHVHVKKSEDRVLGYFGVDANNLPALVLADMSGEAGNIKKYFFEGELTEDAIFEFESKFFASELTPTLKTEAVGENDLAEPVKVVKGTSFEDIVINNDKDVLLEFYAPWCAHCKSLAPKYDELAEMFDSVESVVIAKMDATANEIDHPKVAVAGFPTLYFFPGNDKGNPVKYEGAREVEGMSKYIMEKVSTPFSLDGVESETATEEL